MRRLLLAAGCAIALWPAASATAAGGPAPAVQGGAGATAPQSPVRYVTTITHGRTLLQQIDRRTGVVGQYSFLRGAFGVPGVGLDGSTTGLSADGRTLVLAADQRVFPIRRTRLVVLDAPVLRVRTRLTLRGWFTVDAISPDGRTFFLIQSAADDPLHYAVRAYDLPRRRLVRGAIVDVREPDEAMRGTPMTRATSADGRWAYTLYDRGDEAPFVHALDTRTPTARCIDLPGLLGSDLSRMRLALNPDGGTLVVRDDALERARVDTRGFTVGEAASAAPPAPRHAVDDGGGDGGLPGWPAAAALAAIALAALAAARLRPRRATPSA